MTPFPKTAAYTGRYVLLLLLLCLTLPGIFAFDIQRDVVEKAQSYVGNGYCRGGVAPPCFDCSGFVGRVLKPIVPGLPRVSRDMAHYGRKISRSDLRSGDLVFFATTPNRAIVSHVAIYIGQNSIVHAISDGPNRGVQVTSLNASYWRRHYHSAVRVLPADSIEERERGTAIRYAKGVYTGELEKGEPQGEGRLELSNGDLYEGDFAQGLFEGKGLYIWKSGDRYRGEFREGKIEGRGVFVSAEGERSEGLWQNGELLGSSGESRDSGAEQAQRKETYLEKEDSPWEEWDGYMTGDYYAWREKEKDSFEAWKKKNQPQ